ncbi:hypothetical protein PsorP6_017095 [Peronosclerospora sorghi]|uniref:Uncharacterized protein n=1 Tax=Peronosclerospora sorghi TaxID=230839 RepID=A0ACC0WDT4_9STRA|nr:hypothetical protein PsorP6_017095 [Peronosclerospora sorghi]
MAPCQGVVVALSLVFSALRLDTTQATYEAVAISSASECCSTCIGKPSNTVYNYDPVIFAQCTNVTDGVCCFECGNLGDPTYGDTVSYGDDGVTPVAKAGTYISFTWSGVVNVTYVALKTGQKKTVTPTVTTTAATKKKDTFLICARSPGTIYFRGWGKNTCRQASTEHSITIEKGKSTSDTCDASDVKIPTQEPDNSGTSSQASDSNSTSVAADDTVANCNVQRASVMEVDGVQTCVCVSDWTNPPECDRWPVWKWLVTIGGGVAAFFSIIISVRALLAGHQKRERETQQQYQESQVTPVTSLGGTQGVSYQAKTLHASQYDPEKDRISEAPRKPTNHEFTL